MKYNQYWISPADEKNDEVVCEGLEYTKNFPEHRFTHVIDYSAYKNAVNAYNLLKNYLQDITYGDTPTLKSTSSIIFEGDALIND